MLVFLFFSLMSRIDFIVHTTLYNYGLHFSYEWAYEYWIVYCTIFFTFSFLTGFMYWLGSNKNDQDRKVSIALTTSMSLLFVGGTADIMVFVLWVGRLPPESVIWWWVPWYRIFGVWTTSMQLAFAALSFLIIALLWVRTIQLEPVRFVERTADQKSRALET